MTRLGTGTDHRERELARMRAFATGLLAGMFLLFLAASLLLKHYPWLAYVQAFAEAAMVGALADWFAVAALFRRPLGLPIPHTAVIPRSKERIAESLGQFVEEHFLPPDVIRARLAEVDFGDFIARWLAVPANAAVLAGQLTGLLPDLLGSMDDESLRRAIREKLSDRLRQVEFAPLSGEFLATLTADRRHQRLFDLVLRHGVILIAENEAFIRQKIRANTGWLWKKLSIDERAFNGIMSAVETLVRDLEEDASHRLRLRFDEAVRTFIQNLKEAPDYRDRAESIKEELLANPSFQEYLAGSWDDLRDHLLRDAASPESEIRRHLEAGLARLGENLLADEEMRGTFNPWLRDAIAELVESRRQEMARLIPDTMGAWDADTMARRLELQVGRDLQFIRINGTLVGGLVGLIIYGASRLAGF